MKTAQWMGMGLFGLATGLGLGCGAAPDATALPGEQGAEVSPLSVMRNSTTAFDAIYRQGEDWARIEVRYSSTTTLYRLTTSFGPTPLAYLISGSDEHQVDRSAAARPTKRPKIIT